MKILLLFSLFLAQPSWGDDNVYIMDFLEGYSHRIEKPCWKDDGTFNSERCEKIVEACKFEKKFPSFQTAKIKYLNLSQQARNSGYVNYKVFVEGLSQREFEMRDTFPVGANITVFDLHRKGYPNEEKSITVHYHGKFPASGEVQINHSSVNQNFIFKFPDVLKAGQTYSFSILGQHLRLKPTEYELNIGLSAGVYFINIYKLDQAGKSRQEQKMKLTVTDSVVATSKVINVKDVFKEYNAEEDNKLTWKTKGYPSEFLPGFMLKNQGSEEYSAFESITKVEIPQIGQQNIKDLFELSHGEAQVVADKEQSFVNQLKQIPIHTLRVEGNCFKGKVKATEKRFLVFKTPDEKSQKVGEILITVGPNPSDINSSFLLPDGQKKNFQPNFNFGSCRGEGDAQALHAFQKMKDGWGHIGKGEWGEGGWIKGNYKGIDQYPGFDFMMVSNASIKPIGNGKIEVTGYDQRDLDEAESRESEEQESEEKKSKAKPITFKLGIDKLWNKDDFIPYISCPSYGC